MGVSKNRVPQIMNYNRVFPKKHPYWLLMDVGILCYEHCFSLHIPSVSTKPTGNSLHSCHLSGVELRQVATSCSMRFWRNYANKQRIQDYWLELPQQLVDNHIRGIDYIDSSFPQTLYGEADVPFERRTFFGGLDSWWLTQWTFEGSPRRNCV